MHRNLTTQYHSHCRLSRLLQPYQHLQVLLMLLYYMLQHLSHQQHYDATLR
jgi:hypothetical protein